MSKSTFIPRLVIFITWLLNKYASIPHLYWYEVSSNITKNIAEIQLLYETKREECDKRYKQMEIDSVFNNIKARENLNDTLKTVRENLRLLEGWENYSKTDECFETDYKLTKAAMLAAENVNKCWKKHWQEIVQTKKDKFMEMESTVIRINNTLSYIMDKEIECVIHPEDFKTYNLSVDKLIIVYCIEQLREFANYQTNRGATLIRKSAHDLQDYYTYKNSTLDACFKNEAIQPYGKLVNQITDQISTSILILLNKI